MKNSLFYPEESDSKYFGNFGKFTLECRASHPTGLPPWHSKRLHPVSFYCWWFSGKNKTGRNIWLWVSNSRLPMNLSLSDEHCKRQDRFVCPNLIHGNNYIVFDTNTQTAENFRQSILTYLFVFSLLATCSGFWKGSHHAIRNIHEER